MFHTHTLACKSFVFPSKSTMTFTYSFLRIIPLCFFSFFCAPPLPDQVNVNEAAIVESEVFVYNLGTMFYIDRVLFTSRGTLPATSGPETTPATEGSFTTSAEVERLPAEVAEESGAMPDVLFADAEAATVTTPEEVGSTTTRK